MNIKRIAYGAAIAAIVCATPGTVSSSVPVPVLGPQGISSGSCSQVTLEQCSDPEFLYETSCGAEQRSRMDSECADLLFDAMEAEAEDNGTELSIIAWEIDDDGVGPVVRSDRSAEERSFMPNLFSIHSQQAARGMVADADEVAFNEYDQWLGNGNVVNSCREYVWEKFADLNEFYHEIDDNWDDARAVYRVAYGPGNDRASIGTRHMNSRALRGRDGRVFGQLYNPHRHVKRNALYELVQYPGAFSEVPPVAHVRLLDSLRARSLRTATILDKIEANRDEHGTLQRSWRWHRDSSRALSRDHNPPEDGNGQISIDDLQGSPPPPPAGPSAANLGLAAGTQVRRRLDGELNELAHKQDRLRALAAEWGRANLRFAPSDWSVESAGLAEEENHLDLIAIPPANQGPPLGFANGPPAVNVPAPLPQVGPSDFAGIDAETAVRKRILDEMIEIIDYLDSQSCTFAGRTPCDWSPALFVDDVRNRFGTRQDAAYEWCNDFTGGNLTNVLNLDVVFVDADDYPHLNCSVTTGNTVTASRLESLEQEVADCRQAQIELADLRALDAARNRVRQIEELVNPSTGAFEYPGVERSGGEVKGNEYFGVGYEWGYGFSADINAEICQVAISAGGNAKAWGTVFGKEVILVDALADVDTVERTADLYAKVISKNVFVPRDLFDPVHVEVGEIEPLDFGFSADLSTSRRAKVFETTIVIVVVPLSIAAGVAGNVGASFGLDVYANPADNNGCPSAEVNGSVTPFAGVDGFVEAAVDIFIAAAGIRGNLTIIEAKVPFTAGIGVEVLALTTNPEDYQLFVNTSLNLELTTLSGSIQGFAEIGPCPFCYTGEFNFISWPGLTFEDEIFREEYIVNIGDLFVALGF